MAITQEELLQAVNSAFTSVEELNAALPVMVAFGKTLIATGLTEPAQQVREVTALRAQFQLRLYEALTSAARDQQQTDVAQAEAVIQGYDQQRATIEAQIKAHAKQIATEMLNNS